MGSAARFLGVRKPIARPSKCLIYLESRHVRYAVTGKYNSAFVGAALAAIGWVRLRTIAAEAAPTKARSAGFLGRPGLNRQGVDIGLHQLAQSRVNPSMPGQRQFAGKHSADDVDREV